MTDTLQQALASNTQLGLLCQQLQREAGQKGAVFSVVNYDGATHFIVTAPDLNEEEICNRLGPAFRQRAHELACVDLLQELVDNDTGEWSNAIDLIVSRARRLLKPLQKK